MSNKTINDYEIITQIGEGAYGKVYKAIRRTDNKTIALKVIDLSSDQVKLTQDVRAEVDYLTKLGTPECNPYVVCYHGSSYDKTNNQFLIEMDLVDGITLDKFIDNIRKTETPEKFLYLLLLIAKDLTEGLKHIHNNGIIHNDIKPENIMIERDTYVPVILDFGLACIPKTGKRCTAQGGTPLYVAPEFFTENEARYYASDMWALGILLYRAATDNMMPFIGSIMSPEQLYFLIKTQQPLRLSSSNSQLNNIVNKLLDRNVNTRSTADQIAEMLINPVRPGGSKTKVIQRKPKTVIPLASRGNIPKPGPNTVFNMLL